MAGGNKRTAAKSRPASNEATIGAWLYSFFRGKGFSDAQAKIDEAGALGNLKVESNYNPAAYNAGEGALGIAQWEGGRGPNGGLGNYAAAHHLSVKSLQAQLGYLGHELNGSYAGTVNALRTAPNASTAAYDWARFFEGNDPSSNPTREANATAIYAQIKAGRPLTGGGASGFDQGQPPPPIPGGTNIGGEIADPGGITGILSQIGQSVGGDIAKATPAGIAGEVLAGIETVAKDLAHPVVVFLTNAFLVVAGVVGVVVALVMLAHSDDTPNAAPSGTGTSETGSGVAEAAEAA